MGLLRLSVLGTPEVFHDGSRLSFGLRKAQALLLYLAVEGGMQSRSKLAAFFWPDSEPAAARSNVRAVLTVLRQLLDTVSPAAHSHVRSERDLLGLNPQAPLELDLEVVQQAWKQTQALSTLPPEPQHAALVAQVQYALSLVRGPFLDGFWLGEDAPFDEWVLQQQQQWQVRLQLLLDRLSFWQEIGGELEQAKVTLTRWLALDPLSEEASQRLMRLYLAQGDATAALQVYSTLRTRLAQELQVHPSADTLALVERVRAAQAHPGRRPARRSTGESQPPGELVAPLVGRAAAFRQLVGSFEQARQGRPQAVLLVGEAGIGKTRLATEFVAWARAQSADVLSGHAFEMGGRLPYQPLVGAIGPRLEAENAPEDLLDDLWLAELARLLPELRVRYPDLPAPTQDELSAKLQLFEAVAHLFDALAQRAPLVLLLDDLHWMDGASLDLLRYLAHYWSRQRSRVLLLLTLRREGLDPQSSLAAQLADLGRDLPLSQVSLQPLSQAETLQLVEAVAGAHGQGTALPSAPGTPPSQELERSLLALGDLLFAHTGGQPLYLLETLKLLRERQWLEPSLDIAWALAQEHSQRELLPPSVRALVLTRLTKLGTAARQLVQTTAVLGTQVTVAQLWQMTELGVQVGVEALEEAVGSGMLVEEAAGGPGAGRPASYRFSHELIREVVYTELGAARRQVLHQRALAVLESEEARASELAYHALLAAEAQAAYRYSLQAGDEAGAVFAVAEAIRHYEQARDVLTQQPRLQSVLSAPEVEHLYVHLGQAYMLQQAWPQAQQAYEELVSYAQRHQLPALVSLTLNRLANLAAQQSYDWPKVHVLLERALQMAQTSQDQKALAETEWNLAQITLISTGAWQDPKSAFSHGEQALSMARAIPDQELEARSLFLLGWIQLLGGDFEEAIRCFEASQALYAAMGSEQTASRELSLPILLIGAPLTQSLTNRASEAMCWGFLADAQVQIGQVQQSIRSGRRSLALSKEIKNAWVQTYSTDCLTYGLLEAGAYEEALVLTQPAVALARTLPPSVSFQRLLTTLGSTYQALQQWEEAQAPLEEAVAVAEALDSFHAGSASSISSLEGAVAVAEALDLRPWRLVPTLSHLCMNWAVEGEWGQAHTYAAKAIIIRQSFERALLAGDFSRQYETETLLRGGDERQARAEVHQLGERVGTNRRFRLPYLRSLAVLDAWEGQSEQAIDHLREAAGLAADLGLPGEQWQIQAALGKVYEAGGELAQAHTAFVEATTIIQRLAQDITDEALRARFLAGPQIQPVLRMGQ